MIIEIQCRDCKGTGLYDGFMERKGYPVICSRCDGSGKEVLNVVKFTDRKTLDPKKIKGVVQWRHENGIHIETVISYDEFLKKKEW